MTRLHGPEANIAAMRARLSLIPAASVLAGSLVTLVPIVAQAPLLPPLGFLVFLAWRLMRPEIWPVWAGLPLGLFDDLFSGNPIGTGMLLWTITLLGLEMAENRSVWRDYWVDWLVATAVVVVYILTAMFFSVLTGGGGGAIAPALPQIAISVLAIPVVMRLCARLDRWRLSL